MLGYILAAVIGVVVIGFAFSALGGGTPPARKKSDLAKDPSRPVQLDEPSADEPTPDSSQIASPHEVDSAKRHIPPA